MTVVRTITVLTLAALIGVGFLPCSAESATKRYSKQASRATRHKPSPTATALDRAPRVRSASVLVKDLSADTVLFEKNSSAVVPIASISKLMTAMVVLDASQDMDAPVTITDDDVDNLKGSSSRLRVGNTLSRSDMLRLALMSSENRAASALARDYPGGFAACIEAMNRKSADLGLKDTRFVEPTGLSSQNVSSAQDLSRMTAAAAEYPLIREFSTTDKYVVRLNGRNREFGNTNPLVKSPDWNIGVQKTGFIREAGKCLVMQTVIANRPLVIVLLDSYGRLTRVADANRIRKWVEHQLMTQNHPSTLVSGASSTSVKPSL